MKKAAWKEQARQWSRDRSKVVVEQDAIGHHHIIRRGPEGLRYYVAGPFGDKESAEKSLPVFTRYLRTIGKIN